MQMLKKGEDLFSKKGEKSRGRATCRRMKNASRRRQDTAECIRRVKAIFPVSTSVKTVSTLENPKVLRDFSKVLTVFSHPNSAWEGECLAAVRRWSSCVLLRHSACSALQLRRRQCLMGDNRGNILRRRTMYAGMRPPTITRVTAEIISAMP